MICVIFLFINYVFIQKTSHVISYFCSDCI